MEKPPIDPTRILAHWMEWERGDETPGRVIANLKTDGLLDVLEELAAAHVATSQQATQPAD